MQLKLTRKRFIKGLGASLLGSLGYATLVEPHWLDLIELQMPIANLPDSLVGKKLVQISDIHIGNQVSDGYLKKSFEKVNALSPDIVVYTGDFTSREPDTLGHAGKMFPHLPAGKLGTFGILGNHDYGESWREYSLADELSKLAGSHGVRILRNEIGNAAGLQIIGLDDLWAKRFKPGVVLGNLVPGTPAIVLTHNPDTVDLPVWVNYQGWILAGHTHGGQCKPPFLRAPLLPVENKKYTAGIFELSGNRKLYINKGLGHLIQARFNVRPEITVFELTRA